jgi:hypothetical protein
MYIFFSVSIFLLVIPIHLFQLSLHWLRDFDKDCTPWQLSYFDKDCTTWQLSYFRDCCRYQYYLMASCEASCTSFFFIRHQTILEILFRSLHYQPAQVLNCFCFPGAWFIRSGKGGCCHLFSPLLFLLMFSSRCQRPIYKATLQRKQFV